MSERFFVDGDLALGTVVIEGPEAHHLATVCRSTPGDRLVLFNGDGREYGARVVSAERRRASCHSLSKSLSRFLKAIGPSSWLKN